MEFWQAPGRAPVFILGILGDLGNLGQTTENWAITCYFPYVGVRWKFVWRGRLRKMEH